MSMFSKDAHQKSEGHVSPFEAICVSVGGNVGMGTIGGVATAVATGGGSCILDVVMGFLRHDGKNG